METIRQSFSAIDSYIERNIVSPIEKKCNGRNIIEWGDNNAYPEYLLGLYETVPTLRSIISGCVDYICGDGIEASAYLVSLMKNETPDYQVSGEGFDLITYGGFALQVNRDLTGRVAEILYIDTRFLRSNKDNSVLYYSERWNELGRKDAIEYPAFRRDIADRWPSLTDEERARNMSSIYYYKDTRSKTYPAPLYAAAVKACETERQIDDFHLSDLENHFSSSAMICFNNGVPTTEQKSEIEKNVREKFCGSANGGRILLSWADSKETNAEIKEFKMEDFGERYEALSGHCRRQIFTSFRAIPLLFGLTSEANTGFSTDEFEQAFKLFNRTVIKPRQDAIRRAYADIIGEDALIIKPFNLNGTTV